MTVSILVVDDEADVAALFRQHFRREVRKQAYALHFALSGEEASDKLDAGIEPELIAVLSAIDMPGMDGLSLLERIKAHSPAVPVMMVAASRDEARRKRADALGAANFLTKPVDFAALKHNLEQLLTRQLNVFMLRNAPACGESTAERVPAISAVCVGG